MVIILPLILAIATHGFIVRESVYYEQPTVKFTNEMIVEALVNDGTIDSVKQFSTVANINNRFSSVLTAPELSVLSYDANDDRRNEKLDINLKFSKATTDSVKSLHILFYLQYYIGNEVNTQFKTLVYLELNAINGGNIAYAFSKGNLKLQQKNPIAEGTIKRELYSSTLEADYLNYGIDGILDRYNIRNQTTEYDANPIVSTYGATDKTEVQITVVVPSLESVWYFTSILEVVKHAWIEYLAFFIPIFFILYVWLYGFVVKANVLQ